MASPKKPITLKDGSLDEMSKVERIKLASQGLFFVSDGKKEAHRFGEEVDQLSTGEKETISGEAKELSKFHGIYKQQARGERGVKTQDYFFMLRIKNPGGGGLSPGQWIALDDAADDYADGSLRLTSRQAVQYHRVYGPKLAPLMRHLQRNYREDGTLSACGDVNRNVMTSPIDGLDPIHQPRTKQLADDIATALAPQTSSYFQVWATDGGGNKLAPLHAEEPLYGPQYLPRKFKIGISHSSDNSVDLLTQDIGFHPLTINGVCDGSYFDLYTGGGLGMSHNNAATAPLLGVYFGRIARDQVVDVAKAILTIQKENGDRRDRKQARWKYTLRRLGVDAVKKELRERFQIQLTDAEPQPLPPMQLHLGWNEQADGKSYYGVSIESGRIRKELRAAIREAVESLNLTVRLTPQQDLLLCDVTDRSAVDAILKKHAIQGPESISLVRRNAMACPAKPTCGLAMTDAENILPHWLEAIESSGCGDVDAVIRVTGCPNNCARPPTAEIGIYGYGKNDHVVLVGGSREGTRIGTSLYSRIPGERMTEMLVALFQAIKTHGGPGQPVGEFLHQTPVAQLREWIGIEDGAKG